MFSIRNIFIFVFCFSFVFAKNILCREVCCTLLEKYFVLVTREKAEFGRKLIFKMLHWLHNDSF